ncbi:psbP domain-containing protein 3, chloroplastic [Aristolochia californica]|uniref:psbP domain-containing protein 3, chloroplastic n=1 Tax=Aristolochia californica TaxID=171875 RepID=UPI0035D6F1E3
MVSSIPTLQSRCLSSVGIGRAKPLTRAKGISESRSRSILCFKQTDSNKNSSYGGRRDTLVQIFLSSVSLPLISKEASAETGSVSENNFRTYTDEKNKFEIAIPQEWQVGSGEPNGFKSVTAFYPEEASNSSVSVVITGLGPDFTRLESFGNVDAFAESLVGGLDRSWQRPPGVAAKLIDSRAKNGFYFIEYSLQNPGESCRHLFSAIGMASNGWYNRLYTVTGQYVEEESDKYKSLVEKAVSSFRFT